MSTQNTTSSWGTSVDIVFDEVEINGGRPRTCTEAANFPEYGAQCQSGNWFTSENGDRDRPTGVITQPLPNETITTPKVTVRGSGSDDTGISYIQVMATSNGDWKPVGPLLTQTPFTTQIDLCEAGIPNGPFFLSLQLMDTAGKLSDGVPGLVQLEKKFSCPDDPPICIPNENQIALYSEPNYHGTCVLFEIGEYARLANFQEINTNNTDSIQVGANVMAALYTDNNWGGKKETFIDLDPDLSDNKIGSNQASSLAVTLRPNIPAPPTLDSPESPDGEPLEENDSITLTWAAEGKDITYRTELSGPNDWNKSLDWQTERKWEVGKLAPGEFLWTVWARNISGESQSTLTFTVQEQDLPSVTEMVQAEDTWDSTFIKLQWKALEGENDLDHFEIQMRKDGNPWTDWGTELDANIREIQFVGKPGSTYAFRMRSVDKAGNLEAFPEKAEIKLKMPLNCTSDEFENEESPDNYWSGAAQLELSHTQDHNLCGQQDIDWIQFSAESGSSYHFSIQPISKGVSISANLFGLDHDSILSEAKSPQPEEVAEIDWTAPDSGVFYLQVAASDPNLFGTDTQYQIRVDRTAQLQPTTYLWSTLLLPLIWALVKMYSRFKARFNTEDELPL